QPDRQGRAVLAEGRRSLLEQLDRALVGDSGTPAGLLEADRRPSEQLRISTLPGDVRRFTERLQRVERLPAPVAGVAELEVDLRPLPYAVDTHPPARPQPPRPLTA